VAGWVTHRAARSCPAHGAVANQLGFGDYLESLLKAEQVARQARSRTMMARTAGFPVIKTLDEFDYTFAHGVTKRTLQGNPPIFKQS